MDISTEKVYLWTDSTIVLAWLQKHPSTLKLYVSHRVSIILELFPSIIWRHISTNQNPADHCSRGLSPQELKTCKLWWNGPEWLLLSPKEWPKSISFKNMPEVKAVVLSVAPVVEPVFTLWNRYSSLNKLIRVVAYCLRFMISLTFPSYRTLPKPIKLLNPEISNARELVYHLSQLRYFGNDYHILKSGKPLPKSSKMCSLHPFVDNSNLIRVGGRLDNSNLGFSTKHPIILHKSCTIVNLLVYQIHVDHQHASPNVMMSILLESFYIVGVKSIVKRISRNCSVCQRVYCQPQHQLMGELPAKRVNISLPFTSVGVDMAGPFYIKWGNSRKPTIVKSYVALFICMYTRAVHLELVCDLSTDSFLAAFSRFTARRGMPSEVTSDNGSNFIGARTELMELQQFFNQLKSSDGIELLSTKYEMSWKFSPARTPHFGGLWPLHEVDFKEDHERETTRLR